MASLKTICANLHPQSPYLGFDAARYPLDLQGWGSEDPVFAPIIQQLRPREIIEVGTWKGGSAIHMANLAKAAGIPVTILCVDTWLGGSDHWEKPEYKSALSLVHGYPSLYYQFLANVVHCGHQEVIVPFPIASTGASDYLTSVGAQVDLIYIDAGHGYDDVSSDIRRYWEIVRPGGVMLGDDFYDPPFPGVVRAVNEFGQKIGKQAQVTSNGKWFFQK